MHTENFADDNTHDQKRIDQEQPASIPHVPVDDDSDVLDWDDDDEAFWESTETIRAKWAMDGAKTLDEAVVKLEEFIGYLRELQNEGYELIDEVVDDYGHVAKQSD